MRKSKLNEIVQAIQAMTRAERGELMTRLRVAQASQQVDEIVEQRQQALRMCPHCNAMHVVRNGMAGGLQRYKCRGCGKTFNSLTRTPLARLRHRGLWLDQAQALIDGLSITKVAARLEVARSTAFRWRHRFLALPHHVKSGAFAGIVEADETCWLKSYKGQCARLRVLHRPARQRGGRATQRGMTDEHDIVLVVRDRSGACTDQIVKALDTAHLAAVLQPVLAADAVLCTDGSAALAAAARHIGVEHHAINASIGLRTIGPWHINNVNGYHGRLKNWHAQIQRRGIFLSAPLLGLIPGARSLQPSRRPQALCAPRAGGGHLTASLLNANSAQKSFQPAAASTPAPRVRIADPRASGFSARSAF